MSTPVTIQLTLVSHTNNGKTTLARTLLGMDVGDVRDAAHVTQLAERHPLLQTSEGDALVLWDTPGFGDSVRLFKRLSMSGNPIGWFLREVLDRYRDRPFWLSQQALRAARDEADIVLYLVNASESPQDAGYLPPEMNILTWLDKPVVVLLNQIGPPQPQAIEQQQVERWRQHLAQYTVVKTVLPLDAFARCWVHEHVFYEALRPLVAPPKQAAYARLLDGWMARQQHRYTEAMHISAQQLAQAARDSEPLGEAPGGVFRSALKAIGLGKDEQRRQDVAMAALVTRLNEQINHTTARLLALHRIDPGQALTLNARVRDNFAVRAPVDKAQAGLLGAVVSGAATGLSADLMAGGLTLGGGALLGAIVGGLTTAGAAWGFNQGTDRQRADVKFADPFLQSLLTNTMLRYLAVAHYGRGRGNYVEGEAPAFWQEEVERVLGSEPEPGQRLWHAVRAARTQDEAVRLVEDRLDAAMQQVIEQLYPGAGKTSRVLHPAPATSPMEGADGETEAGRTLLRKNEG